MGPFITDLVLGIMFTLCLAISILGLLSFRYRREIGPILLLISGIPGSIASILWVFLRAGVFDVPDVLLIALYISTVVLLLVSILLWRSRK